MSAIVAGLQRALGDSSVVVCECRRCGTTVDPEVDRCPACDAAKIARYEL